MDQPKVADCKPIGVELEEGETYFFCACGHSSNQPFCDGAHKSTSFRPQSFKAEASGKKFLCMCKRTQGAPYCDGSHKNLPA